MQPLPGSFSADSTGIAWSQGMRLGRSISFTQDVNEWFHVWSALNGCILSDILRCKLIQLLILPHYSTPLILSLKRIRK